MCVYMCVWRGWEGLNYVFTILHASLVDGCLYSSVCVCERESERKRKQCCNHIVASKSGHSVVCVYEYEWVNINIYVCVSMCAFVSEH